MKVVVDDKIPFIREAICKIADEVEFLPGNTIGPDNVRFADALIIRTRTICNRDLLENSRVKFIATATIGFDHIDTEYLAKRGIAWANCPGCNAESVAQYIHSCLLILKREKHYKLKETCIGIVGAGHVGSAVARTCRSLDMHVLLYDPPRQEEEQSLPAHLRTPFAEMADLLEQCNIISFHTPLTRTGKHPTLHMGSCQLFKSAKKSPLVINTSRGAVINNMELVRALDEGYIRDVIIDTWENEPHINAKLLEKAYIATPHIAGYSADGKANATRMALEALCRFFNIQTSIHILPPSLPDDFKPVDDKDELALQLYNPLNDSKRLKQFPEAFESLRGNYPLRRESYP